MMSGSNTKVHANKTPHQYPRVGVRIHDLLVKALTTSILAAGAVIILIPLLFMFSGSVKSPSQWREFPASLIPYAGTMVDVNGKQEPLFRVTFENGGKGLFVDPATPNQVYELVLAEQEPLRHLEIHWENYREALTSAPFGKYINNSLFLTFSTLAGVLISCSLVAYGFSRFRAPGLDILFLIMLSTIMLPPQVTLIPLYVLFQKIGWVDTFLPLIIPNFFANAWDVFLLRQFFKTVPREIDDSARIDGANSLQILWYIMVPQARPALVAVSVFHILYSWNNFYEPLIYLHSSEKWTVAIGLQSFSALYYFSTHWIMAASVVMVLPIIILFFFSQRIFTQGVVISGIKG
jgi:ABC-type glycerol-3-phosphate transport system permease component